MAATLAWSSTSASADESGHQFPSARQPLDSAAADRSGRRPGDGADVPRDAGPAKTMTMFLTPVIGKPVMTPTRVMAGKRVTVTFPVTRSDAAQPKPLTSGTMVCDPSIGGKVIPHAESFTNGVARLSFVVPKTAKGKLLKVKVTIKAPTYRGEDGTSVDIATGQLALVAQWYQGQSATKIASFLTH